MGKVLDFMQARAELTIDESTNSTDARGVFYFEIAKKLIFALSHLQTKYIFNYIFSGIKITPFSAVGLTTSNFFVKLPDIVSHGLKFQISVENSYLKDPEYATTDLSQVCSSFIFDFLNEFHSLIVTKELESLMHIYCFTMDIDNQPNKSAISFKGPNNSQNMTMILEWPDQASDNLIVTIEYKLWIPVTDNPLENLDHVYAIDMVNYIQNLIMYHVPGVTPL